MRTRKPVRVVLVALLAVLSAFGLTAVGCQFPRDPEGTLDRVEGGTLRVGVIDDPPWVDLGRRQPSGIEPDLVREFAEEHDADVAWIEGSESDLAAALEGFQLDLIIGGLDRGWPYGKELAMTRPFIDTEVQIGVPPGTELSDDLGGVEIWVERNSEAAALLKQEEEDAIPLFFDSLDEVDGPALLDTYDIDALGYELTDYILRDDEHSMATAAGENGFLVELENFLLDRGSEAERLLHEAVQR